MKQVKTVFFVIVALFSLTLIGANSYAGNDTDDLGDQIIRLSEEIRSLEMENGDLLALIAKILTSANASVDLEKETMEIGDAIFYNQGDFTGDPVEDTGILKKGILVRIEETPHLETLYGIYNPKNSQILYRRGSRLFFSDGMPKENNRTISFNW
jgi:hypothetical protein